MYSVIVPPVVILAILLAEFSVNHMFPSGPAAMPYGIEPAVTGRKSVTAPVVGLMRPMRLFEICVYQRFPSGPAAMPFGCVPAEGDDGKFVTTPAVVVRLIILLPRSVFHRLPSGPDVISA